MTKKCTGLMIIVSLLFDFAFSQDSITRKESIEIRLTAERTLNQFRQLLNFIATPEVGEKEMGDVMYRSHSGSFNKIFDSSVTVIENDINPNHRSSSYTTDLDIVKYLKDFDLFYMKSTGSSVVFSNIRVSNIKKSQKLHLKVYYNSFFPNKSKGNDTQYVINNRVAEMAIKKINSRWVTYISNVRFFNPADTLNDVMYDIALKYDPNFDGVSLIADSAEAAAKLLSFEQELKEKENQRLIEQFQKESQQFKELIDKGDEALNRKDFTQALQNYIAAKDIRPYDLLPISKINLVNNEKVKEDQRKTQLFSDLIRDAERAELNREYRKAIDFYYRAKNENPEEGSKKDAKVKLLNAKLRNLEELEERYKIGQYKQAIDGYDALIKKEKPDSDYFLGRGKCYDKLGDSKKAFRDYNQAVSLDESNIQALLFRADLYKRMNEPFKASTDYRDYVRNYKLNTNAYLELVDILMMINPNNTSEAIKYLDEALAEPENLKVSELYLKKGLLLLAKNDFENADKNFSTVIKIDSNHAFAYYNRGKCQLNFKNIHNAAIDFEKARKKGLDSINIQVIETFAENFYRHSVSKSNASKDSAIILVNYAIDINPSNATYQFAKGGYYSALGKYLEAIYCYDQAVNLSSSYVEAFYERGLCYYKLANFSSAIESWRQATTLNSLLYTAHKGLADSYFAIKDYSSAAINAELAIRTINSLKTSPNADLVAQIYNVMGKSYYELNDTEKSINALKNAIRKNPMYAEAYYNRGLSYYKSALLTDAVADLSKAASMEKHPEWYYLLAKAYQDKKDFGNAAVNYGLAIGTDTADSLPHAFYLRGYSNYQLQNYPVALNDYRTYSSLNRDSEIPSFNLELGNIYLNIGKYDSAFMHYNKIYLKDSTNGYAMYGIASALNLKGNKDEALTWFEKSFQLKTLQSNEIKRDKLLGSIRDDKRFKALMRKYY